MPSSNAEVLLAGMNAFSRRDLDVALEGIAPDTIWEIGPEMLLEAGVYEGREGVRGFWGLWHDMFDDFELEIEGCEDIDERHVLATARARGRGAGSGVEVQSPRFVQVAEIRDGQIARVWMHAQRSVALSAAGLDA